MSKLLIDEHGVVLGEFDDDVRIVAFDPMNFQRKKVDNKLFYKLFIDSSLIFTNTDIHFNYFRTFFKLIRLLKFGNEFLVINGVPANIRMITEYCDIHIDTLNNHLRKLEKLDILVRIKKGREKHIMINPYFISFGMDNTSESLKIFSSSVWSNCSIYVKNRKYFRKLK